MSLSKGVCPACMTQQLISSNHGYSVITEHLLPDGVNTCRGSKTRVRSKLSRPVPRLAHGR